MKEYSVFVFEKVEKGWVQEGHVDVHHLIAPKFYPAPKASLSEEQVKSILSMVGRAMDGDALKVDLVTFNPVIPELQLGENGAEPVD